MAVNIQLQEQLAEEKYIINFYKRYSLFDTIIKLT